ncbi:acetyl-CoA carboxylase biotin carboxylase subunit [Candidatus Gracilibacteria bacterium]|nr:acetyl-CoA carboxylase biotin carboxylase subunit [Candidatus Gracilibacteria bacterium]
MFERVLIANRGEIAVRIIRACRELGMSPVAVYSAADAQALHVRLADRAIAIGPAPAAQSYLRGEAIVAAALEAGARAVHPGYGFLAENDVFAAQCRTAGLVFVGPPPEVIAAMGGKIGARAIAQAANVPVVPGYDGHAQTGAALLIEAERIGYPLLIKASAGGGGKGMRVVRSSVEFAAALEGAQREAAAAFGDTTVFLEQLIERPRHIEIQVLADSHGTIVHLGERECSIQRRHQKILEESPSPALTPELRQAMGAAAVRVARAANYVNAGTVEFVLDAQGRFYFLEMNTRLQVEHPVTELVSGLDLVQLQFAIAAGQPLPFSQAQLHQRGHAIEVRLYAEDPITFLPAVGRLQLLEPPVGPGVRVDTGLSSGDEVTVHYDPMIAKLIVVGADRAAAIARMQRALAEYAVLGLTTNLPLLQAIVAHPAFVAGATHTSFLADHQLKLRQPPLVPELLAAATIVELRAQPTHERDPFARLWRMSGLGVPLSFKSDSGEQLVLADVDGDQYTLTIGERRIQAHCTYARPDELLLRFDAQTQVERFRIARDTTGAILIAWRGANYHIERRPALSLDTAGKRQLAQAGSSLLAPMPGTVVKVLVVEGETVAEGQALLVIEAMKMEHTVVAPAAGVVQRLPYAAGASVAGGVPLVEIGEHQDIFHS